MGLIRNLEDAATRQHTPKVAFVAPAQDYVSSSGKAIPASAIDLHARALSMGKLHHAMMGTAAVAIGTGGDSGHAGQSRGRWWRTRSGDLRPSLRHAARGCAGRPR
jgi:2-methylaconitate cis-trans-isomerase PrpF